MKNIFLILFSVFCACVSIQAQKTDVNWVFGYGYRSWLPVDSALPITFFDFSSEPSTLSAVPVGIRLDGCSVSLSDTAGNLLFYTNCQLLLNKDHKELWGSHHFNAYRHHNDSEVRDGLNKNQAMIGLPHPNNPESYYLIYSKMDLQLALPDIAWLGMQYSRIDMRWNDGLGAMVEKQVSIIPDSVILDLAGLTATKHANGRDWWIIQPLLQSNKYVRILLTPEGPIDMGIQEVGTVTMQGLSGAVFSPDGSRYVRNNMVGGLDDPDYLDIYDFDRCSGLLSNHVRFAYGLGQGAGGGVAISPNNRYLYVPHSQFTYQYDLDADDISASKDTVAIYDGVTDSFGNAITFFRVQLAPDGRMYLNSAPASSEHHIINQPDGKGMSCEFIQRGIVFPTNNTWSMVNFPNYRLGPIDGSSCDTLGLNNIPLAGWRYDSDCPPDHVEFACWKDDADRLKVRFTDASWYGPETFSWIIDGVETSLDQDLIYDFPESGIYHVCHTAHNENGSDTLCRMVTVSDSNVSVSPDLPTAQLDLVKLFPNPTSDFVHIELSLGSRLQRLAIYSSTGRLLETISSPKNEINVTHLSTGVYFMQVEYTWKGKMNRVFKKFVVK